MSADTFAIQSSHEHRRASEVYVTARFDFADGHSAIWVIPVVYPRGGLDLTDDAAIKTHLQTIQPHLHPDRHGAWRQREMAFWAESRSSVTRPIFEKMASNFDWYAYGDLPGQSSNAARRIQGLKDKGYTLATAYMNGAYRFQLLPLPRGEGGGYESWSPALRKRIASVLANFDAYEGKTGGGNLLPDHKFPEARWDAETRRETLEHLTDADIRRDFQLITNQRNQQKREVCRACLQTDRRGAPFGVPFFYEGGPDWPAGVPKRGKNAEAGCKGCGWYDLQNWRQALVAKLSAP